MLLFSFWLVVLPSVRTHVTHAVGNKTRDSAVGEGNLQSTRKRETQAHEFVFGPILFSMAKTTHTFVRALRNENAQSMDTIPQHDVQKNESIGTFSYTTLPLLAQPSPEPFIQRPRIQTLANPTHIPSIDPISIRVDNLSLYLGCISSPAHGKEAN